MQEIARGARKASCATGHGCGKSSMTSWMIIHALLTKWPIKIVVTAPTQGQLFDALGSEVKRWIKELPPSLQELLTIKSERIELTSSPTEAFCVFKVSRADQPEALQGVHADHVLLICDEASGVPDQVFEAAYGSMSAESATIILLGNPLRSQGYFYDTHHKLKNSWYTKQVSCLDSPLVSPDFVEEMREKYGENSNQWRCRVEGKFPLVDEDLLIPRELVVAATNRVIQLPAKTPVIWGLDVARLGADASVLVERQSRKVTKIHSWRKLDLMALSARVAQLYDEAEEKPTDICCDQIGLGSGVLDRLRQLGLPARGVNVSEAASMSEIYFNLRSELWFKVRDWLKGDVSIPNNPQLIEDLCAPKYVYRPNGTLGLEKKEETVKRLGSSPDFADALTMTFASRSLDAAGNYVIRRREKRRVGVVC